MTSAVDLKGERQMRRSRALRLTVLVLLGIAAFTVLAAAASAKPVEHVRFHDEDTFVDDDFCGLTVNGAFVVDGKLLVNPHGGDGLLYFLEHVRATTVLTNPANGKSITAVSKVVNHDLRVTDNGDGTLTVLFMATGNDVLYGPDGKAIARNPGQVRIEFLIDHGGTPNDPEDDIVLSDELVKGSTGRSDDFCGAVVPALS
jgi:hypothetical protein